MPRNQKLIDPKGRVNNTVYRRTLGWVNEVRKAAGLKPLAKLPPGEPKNECNCPIARALKPAGARGVSGIGLAVKNPAPKKVLGIAVEGWEPVLELPIPDVVEGFISEFDNAAVLDDGYTIWD